MSKKNKEPLSFEELAREKERKEKKGILFRNTFLKAFALFASFALVYFTVVIAFVPEMLYKPYKTYGSSSGNSGGSYSGATNTSTNTNTNSGSTDNGTSADDNGGSGEATPADNNGGSGEATPAASDALTEFNEAINKVKSEAKVITHTRGGSKTIDGVNPVDDSSKLPFIIPKSAANSIINAAMGSNGVKDDGSQIGSDDFPVEHQTYSSQLTADDVVSATKNGNTITIVIKDDELGQADNGHCSKAMNVIKSETIMANIPSIASSIANNAQTSAKNGTIVVTLDDNGHVVAADYSFDWDIRISGSGLDAILHLASEEHYTMAY